MDLSSLAAFWNSLSIVDRTVLVTFLISLALLLSPLLGRSRLWRATVIPLASIIGSGYLVAAPLLYHAVGDFAVLAMAAIVLLAYAVGAALRFNIRHAEPLIYEKPQSAPLIAELERISNLVLAFSYLVAVAFYLRLMSAFIFSGFFKPDPLLENLLTTAVLLFIGVAGFLRGLEFLAFLDRYGVALNLSIIFAFLSGLLVHAVQNFSVDWRAKPFSLETLRILAGVLLIVQGFETAKYLREAFDAETRIKSMKLAQIISGLIYVSFIFLITPFFKLLDEIPLTATGIIVLAAALSPIMGYLIKVGPLVSQFSAAVADTTSAGGLIREETHGRISSRVGYLLVSIVGVVLVWSANIFQIIAYASKAFAFYYAIQTLIAALVARRLGKNFLWIAFSILSLVMVLVAIFAKSAE